MINGGKKGLNEFNQQSTSHAQAKVENEPGIVLQQDCNDVTIQNQHTTLGKIYFMPYNNIIVPQIKTETNSNEPDKTTVSEYCVNNANNNLTEGVKL